jgi:pentatricopeptide repeat protein
LFAQIIKEASRRGNLKYYNKFINEAAKRKQLGLALELFSDLRKQNLQADVFTYTCLLNACVRSNNVVKAQEVFESMKNAKVDANEVTFTTMIKGFAQSQQCGKAFEMIQTMREMKLKPNIRTYNAVFRGCFRNGDTDVAVKAFQDMKHHSIQPDATVMQMMIKIYAQAVMIDQAMGVLDTAENKIKVPIDPSVYLLLASMSCLAGVRLKMIESLAAKFDAAVKEAQEQPATNGTGGARLSSVASVELEFERAQLQSLIDKRTKGYVHSFTSNII